MSNEENLLEVKKNQVKMLYKRGYSIPENELMFLEEEEVSVSTFMEEFPSIEDLSHTYEKKTEKKKEEKIQRIFVFYLYINAERDIGKEEVIPYITRLEESGCSESILITDRPLAQAPMEQINSFTELAITALRVTGNTTDSDRMPYFIQHFHSHELMYDPTEHFTVPEHTILTEQEKEEFSKKQQPTKLPSIKYKDRMAKYYGAKPGQVIRIRRPNITQSSIVKEYYSYSYVIY